MPELRPPDEPSLSAVPLVRRVALKLRGWRPRRDDHGRRGAREPEWPGERGAGRIPCRSAVARRSVRTSRDRHHEAGRIQDSARPLALLAVRAASDELPQGDAKVAAVREMFDTIAPRYDLVNRIMTFRMDVGWRRKAVASLQLPARSLVLDIAAGTGDLCREVDAAGYSPVAVDLSLGMLRHARSAAPRVQADALRLPVPDGAAAGAVSGFALRNFADLTGFFRELARVVRPGGRIALLDVAEPVNPVLKAGHSVYFGKVVPRIGGLLSDGAAYRYLPKSVAYLPMPAVMLDRLRNAGFEAIERQLLSAGITQLITATRSER